MRLKRLELKAFGPFTDRVLEFDSKEPGLHIIFGANEAGKSSSLRGLKALLYGFHPQTPDNFLHSYDQLLVGGCLENKDGQEILFQRRKKRVGDLIDATGKPLDADELAAYLHGVEPEIFESLYGIDHSRLVEGGNEILAQKGEVGQTLFAAGAGISSLSKVIDELEQEAVGLFKSAGQLPEINKAIKRYKEHQREVRDASLSSKDWSDLQKVLKGVKAERANLEKDRNDKSKELRRLERLEQAIPELASLKVWQERLQAMGKVIVLPPDIGDRHQQVDQAIREAKGQLQKDSDRLEQIEEKRKAISLNKVLLEQAEVVDDFHQRLGEYRKGQKDKSERNGMRINLRKEAALLLKQVRPDLPLEDVEKLRLVLGKKRTIQTLSSQFEAINQRVSQAKNQSKVAEQEMQEMKKNFASMPESKGTQGLVQVVKLARKAGDLDTQLEKYRNEIEQNKKESLVELKRIGNWFGDLTALQELALPLVETVQQFEKEFNEIGDERRSLEKERKKASKELKEAKTEIKKIEYGGQVPSEEKLIQTRKKREFGWQLLRRQWLGSEDVTDECRDYDLQKPLPEAYEGFVNQADLIADRLRHEAERVANAVNLRVQMESHQELLAECDSLKDDLDQRERELDAAWTSVWEPLGVKPFSPKEMSGWLTAMENLRYRVGDLLKKEQEIQGEEARRHNLRQNLLKELKAMGEKEVSAGDTLGPILIFAETLLEETDQQKAEAERLQERQKQAKKDFDQAEEDLKAAQESLATWQDNWNMALSGLGLKGEISTLEAMDYIDTLHSCLNKVKEADDLQKRIEGIDRDADELEEEVEAFLMKVNPEMLTLPLDQEILQLKAALVQAQKDSTLYDQLSEEFDALQYEVSGAEKTLQAANEQMAELSRIARCEKSEDLGAAIGRSVEHQKIQEKVSNIEATLAKIGSGAAVDKLDEHAAEVDVDELPGQISSLQQDLEEKLNPAINRVSQEIGEIINKLNAMDGSAKAAEAKEKGEQELARIRRLAERYVRVKMASKILQQEIERYREEHQDPVLKIASRYFADLTLNSFDGLKADVDDKGEPVLVGIRPDGKWTGVAGMSDGTRDQLYLALRLASLEWRLESSEAMPFIVDDILVNFDDERSRATLEALMELAKKNQVILFTHHQAIVDEALKLQDHGTLEVHNL